jgi:hypothetical protein
MLSVTFFYREPRKTGMSMEGIFKLVKGCLQERIEIKEFFCDPALSRFQNTILAGKASGEINHITGDVNFLAIGFKGKKNVLTIHDFGFYENPVLFAAEESGYSNGGIGVYEREVDPVFYVPGRQDKGNT